MILKAYESNNGYRCSCCSGGYEDYDWIKEEEALSIEEMLDRAYDFNENIDGLIRLQYEKDGVFLYGYYTYFSKRTTEVNFQIGDKVYRIVADGLDKEITSKEDILAMHKDV